MIHIAKKAFKVLSLGGGVLTTAMLRHGVAASVEHVRLLPGMACSTVVDIGANRGQFALIARKCFPDARIDSFEPLAEPANRFEKVFAGDTNTNLYRVAIGVSEDETTIHVSKRDDSSSLLPIGKEQMALFSGTGERETRTIRVVPLDGVLTKQDIQSPALLKLDVQGYELQALQGCDSLLHCFKYIYAECSFVELYEGQALADEVIAHLHQRGFYLKGVYNMSYDKNGRAIQADFMFAEKSNPIDTPGREN
jgi:FkbM family methyltransferase